VQRRVTATAAALAGFGAFGHFLGLLSASAVGSLWLVGAASVLLGALCARTVDRI
jgi:hypothetical protein